MPYEYVTGQIQGLQEEVEIWFLFLYRQWWEYQDPRILNGQATQHKNFDRHYSVLWFKELYRQPIWLNMGKTCLSFSRCIIQQICATYKTMNFLCETTLIAKTINFFLHYISEERRDAQSKNVIILLWNIYFVKIILIDIYITIYVGYGYLAKE